MPAEAALKEGNFSLLLFIAHPLSLSLSFARAMDKGSRFPLSLALSPSRAWHGEVDAQPLELVGIHVANVLQRRMQLTGRVVVLTCVTLAVFL